MSAIKSNNTSIELKVRKALWKLGLRYRINSKLIGKPDIIFSEKRIAIFIDGCFWHKCPDCYRLPKTNQRYWQEKIKHNSKRDRTVNTKLRKDCWKVLRFYECEINRNFMKVIKKIQYELNKT